MAHRVTFEDFDGFILTEDEVRDLIDLFYRWGDARFTVRTDEKERKFRGQHTSGLDSDFHTIVLVKKNIVRDFGKRSPLGGNVPSPSLRVGAAAVLVHEIQHANQAKLHFREMGFYGTKLGLTPTGKARRKQYRGRACERDARAFVDERLDEICAYFAEPPPTRLVAADMETDRGEALAVADALLGRSEVALGDVREGLRAANALTPGNVRTVLARLRERGIEVEGVRPDGKGIG